MLSRCCKSTASPSRIYKPAGAFALILLALLIPLNPWAKEQRCLPAATPGLIETLSGLKIRESTVHDIQSRLGPTLVFKNHPETITSRMCYVSTLDYTLISFTTERNVITRLQVLSDKHHYDRWDWCTATPISSDDLTLVNGITLGARPEDIVSILGNAHSRDRDNWRYSHGLTWLQHQTKTSRPKDTLPWIALLELEFTNARLIHFDIKAFNFGNNYPIICP